MNILYAQSGGVTAVINASAAGVIAAAQRHGARLYAARYGMAGLLEGDIRPVPHFSPPSLQRLAHTPGGYFGSSRFDLPEPEEDPALYDRLFAQLQRHSIDALLYNGGNGSIYSVAQIDRAAQARGYSLRVIGIPKTIDNDLEGTHFSPGYPSAARYLATSFLEASLDLASMRVSGRRAFVLETMGRNAGWLAAAVGLVHRLYPSEGPHLIVLPEMSWQRDALLAAAEKVMQEHGYCTLVVAEGARLNGELLAYQGKERRRYVQLGGAGNVIGQWLREGFGAKVHVAVPDYLQRAAAHWASGLDRRLAWQCGETAVEWAQNEMSGVMVGIAAAADGGWRLDPVPAAEVGNRERRIPASWIDEVNFGVRDEFFAYLEPLLADCDVSPCGKGGLPDVLMPGGSSV